MNFKDQFKSPNIVRICAYCAKELKVDSEKLDNSGWIPSHGYCINHYEKLMKQIGLSDGDVRKALNDLKEVPCADLHDPKNKPLLNWLLNPTPKK